MNNKSNIALYTECLFEFIDNVYDGDYTKMFPNYTLYDNEHKAELEKKIFDHYYFYEIGYETEEMFAKEFMTYWNEIIPMANNYFRAMASPELINFVNDTKKRNYTLGRTTNAKEGKINATSTSKQQFKDTPYTSYATDTKYNTSVTDNSSSSSSEQTTPSTGSQNDIVEEIVTGLSGLTPAEAIDKYMNIVVDVDLYIIDKLRRMFIEVY